MKTNENYQHFEPSPKLSEYVHSFWMHRNSTQEAKTITLAPDGYFKIIIYYQHNKITRYFLSGLITKPKEAVITPQTIGIGCRFKILAPEYLIGREVASILNEELSLDPSYLNARHFDFENLEVLKEQWEKELLKIMPRKNPHDQKIRLSRLLYETMGSLSVSEVSNQIFWEQKQINRYLNKYVGTSLKTYLNIQRAYSSYFDIKKGKLSPDTNSFYDQSHFIKEIKKHTGVSPKEIYQKQEDKFKQINNIEKK